MKVTSIKGFRDVLPEQAARRRRIVDAARAVMESYGYGEIEIPIMEKVELFRRSVGSSSDIVEKEMYAFEDRDGTLVALRPEGTASVVRAYVEAGMPRSHPVCRLYYSGFMFRRERPQKGRLRQFTQIGAEFFGRDDAAADAETLCMVDDICKAVGVSRARIEVNSLGDERCRPAYREALANFAAKRVDALCDDCRARMGRNPLRLLDCKNENCREAMSDAPLMPGHLCPDCEQHHRRVLSLCEAAGVELFANPRMVRGLDYYCRSAFEISAQGLGSQDSIGGGGRYDGLVSSLGGPDTPGVGFAFGVERLELAVAAEAEAAVAGAPAGAATASAAGAGARPDSVIDVLLAPVGDATAAAALRLAREMRRAGLAVEMESPSRRLKAQMKRADKLGVKYVVIIGEEELAAGRATVRDMRAQRDHAQLFDLDAPAATITAALPASGRQ